MASLEQTQRGSHTSFAATAKKIISMVKSKKHSIFDEKDDDLYDLLISYSTRNRNKYFFDLSNFLVLFLLRITRVFNLSNFLACLLVPVMPEIEISGLALTNQVVPDVTSLLDSRYQA